MSIEVLVSTMNLKDENALLKRMNINGKSVIINQKTNKELKDINSEKTVNRVYTYNEKGLSKSRNKAIEKSNADICIIADDDLKYVDNYEKIVSESYQKYKDADIIVFYVESLINGINKKKPLKEGKIGYLLSLKVQSVQVTFKRKNIVDNGIKFDENFGAGSANFMGEENIFLYDCLRKNMKIYSVPIKIATLEESESTWFTGYTNKFFRVKGACFYRLTKMWYVMLIMQFAIRKYKIYKQELSLKSALKEMFLGASDERKRNGKRK